MKNNNYYKRWCEIQFYQIAKKLYERSHSFQAFDSLSHTIFFYSNCNPVTTKQAMITMMNDTKFAPSKSETIVLAWMFRQPIGQTKKLLKVANRRYYDHVDRHKADPMGIYPKLTDEVLLDHVVKFIEGYKEMKGEMFI